nr:J domain-containing protein [Photobacterium carnosum]
MSNGLNDLSPYAILGVPEGCSDLKQIKENYKRLSHIYHADKSQSSETSDNMMKLINEAHQILKKNKPNR